MKKIISWLVLSSQDPEKVSLMIKGILMGGVTYVLFFAGLFHINLGASSLSDLIDAFVNAIKVGLEFISMVMAFWGLARKIYLTLQGKNKVLNQ